MAFLEFGKSWLLLGVIVANALIGVVLTAVYFLQDNMLYLPYYPSGARKFIQSPETLQIWNYERMYIKTVDSEKLFSWFFKVFDKSKRPTVIYFHGNAGNISHRLVNIREMLENLHVNVLAFDYRGYGLSSGVPSETGLKIDAQAVLEYLLSRHDIDQTKLIAFGRSLGAAVAIDVVHNNPTKFKALIVENTFTSISDMVDVKYGWLRPLKFLLKNRWDSISKIRLINNPTLFISGVEDLLIPAIMVAQLYKSSPSKSKKIVTFFSGHNDTWTDEMYYKTMGQWLDQTIYRFDTI